MKKVGREREGKQRGKGKKKRRKKKEASQQRYEHSPRLSLLIFAVRSVRFQTCALTKTMCPPIAYKNSLWWLNNCLSLTLMFFSDRLPFHTRLLWQRTIKCFRVVFFFHQFVFYANMLAWTECNKKQGMDSSKLKDLISSKFSNTKERTQGWSSNYKGRFMIFSNISKYWTK